MITNDKWPLFRKIPAVDTLLLSPMVKEASIIYPRSLILKATNQVLDELRTRIEKGEIVEQGPDLSIESVSDRVVHRLKLISIQSLRPVINATGVVVHTNLGRSVLPEKALKKFRSLAGGYSNLEYDLDAGKRGSRYTHVEDILRELTSAEAAMVVNNNAAAVLISLQTLAEGRDVVVSLGQLVEIGGTFRIPDVMRKSGANMVGVGTTNKTHLRDYEDVIGPETALLLKVHTSNFRIVGFTEEVPLAELVKLGRRHGIPVMEDLGSGCLVDLSKYGLSKEPTVREVLSNGADLVTFSGDKLLGGPQAGIILGREDLIRAIKKNQLARALRIDKLTVLALEETLRLYRDERSAIREIPSLKMICQTHGSLTKKAARLLKYIGRLKTRNFSVELADGISRVGGGALPHQELRSRLLCLVPEKLSSRFMESWLRAYDPPVIARLEREKVLLDVRTILERELKTTAQAIRDLALLQGRERDP
ncbi:MAG: L-seryl-tRNA(Sec) selenium transferase [Thermodesulfobacteriota bacterium]|nr:L-seryl-tRNA(Sec) selenium transferase [Thermodesulfobacteriota bacterium]